MLLWSVSSLICWNTWKSKALTSNTNFFDVYSSSHTVALQHDHILLVANMQRHVPLHFFSPINHIYLVSYILISLQQPTLSDMTMYEMNFSLLVEDTLRNIVLPEYRQIIVEVNEPVHQHQQIESKYWRILLILVSAVPVVYSD